MITESTPAEHQQEAAPTPVPAAAPHSAFRIPHSTLAWLIVPLLAVAAYAPTLAMWFVSDDFGHLLFHQSLPFPKALIAFDVPMFYRPLSTILTWNLGYALFGTNAFPYHLVSLLLHAIASLFLGRAVATIAADSRVGWLTGAIFAVYPLSTEPVAWLASQWDLLGAVCVTGSVWAFSIAWRTHSRRAYILSIVAAFLAVAMKESTLPLPLVMPFVALATELSPRLITTSGDMSTSQKLALAKRILLTSLPFLLPSLSFVGLRLYAAGTVGGYSNVPTDYQHFFWDSLVAASLEVVMPLNRLVFGQLVVQVVGALVSGFLLLGLVLWGRRRWPLLLLALAWWLAFVAPVLNLIPPTGSNPTLEGNRIFYLSLMGFAIALASLLAGFLEEPWSWVRKIGRPAVAIAVLAALPLTWVQLQPWLAASNQTGHVVDEMGNLIAPMPKNWIEINITHLPDDYEGAYVLRNGLDFAMIGFHDQLTRVYPIQHQRPEELANPFKGANGRFNLDFDFNPKSNLYFVRSLSGVTNAPSPPRDPTRSWDFSSCRNEPPTRWQPSNLATQCAPTYITLSPTTPDPALIFPNLNIDLTGKSWVRLGVSARYPTFTGTRLGQWFWQTGSDTTWAEDRSQTYYLDATHTRLVYWTYLRVDDIGTHLNALRFDPINDTLPTDLFWITLDVK